MRRRDWKYTEESSSATHRERIVETVPSSPPSPMNDTPGTSEKNAASTTEMATPPMLARRMLRGKKNLPSFIRAKSQSKNDTATPIENMSPRPMSKGRETPG